MRAAYLQRASIDGVRRPHHGILLAFVLGACSAKSPSATEAPTTTAEKPGVATPAASTTAAQAQVQVPPPDPREAALSATVLDLLEKEHLLRKKIDDDVSRTAFATYLDKLDPTKMFLLDSDRKVLGKYADKIDDELRSGRLDLAHDGAKMFAARVEVVDKMVASILAAPLNHDDEEFIELDPKKTQPATTDDELKDRWRRRLELEVLERVATMEARLAPPKDKDKKDKSDDEDRSTPLASIPTTPEGRETKAREDLAKSYAGRFARLRQPAPLDAASDLVNSVTGALDPHTTYLPPADKANFDIHMSGSLEGIGAVLRERDHYTEVVEIVPGGASWRQGDLAAGDLILSVQQDTKEPVDVADMRIDDVVKMIRGPKGTVVRLHVQKPTGLQTTIAITRDIVVVEETYARGAIVTPKGKPSYGYILLPSFYGGRGSQRSAASDVHKLLTDMKKQKVAGVIIDIRSNGGGLLGDAIEMTGDLIDKGPVVQVQDSRGRREVLDDDHPGEAYDGPVIVMVDRFSASASEILAGALQDYHRALIVGTGATHGKGTVQTLADLDQATGGKIELGVLKITIQQFFRVSGSSTQREGVTPDVVLPDPAGYIEAGEKQLEHALAWSSIGPASHEDWKPTWDKAMLVKDSAARVAKHPILAKIAAATAVLKTRMADTRVPLAKTAWEARRKEQKAALEAVSPDLDKAAAKFAVKAIDDPAAPVIAPGPNGKTDDRIAKWSASLARDPWVEETLNILGEMKR